MIPAIPLKKCDTCGKDYILLKCICQYTPDELEANRIKALEAIQNYNEAVEAFKEKHPDVDIRLTC